jgi:hypothetical protein
MLLLLLSGIEPNPGPRPPKYPCGICKKAVKNMGQRALACDDRDKVLSESKKHVIYSVLIFLGH